MTININTVPKIEGGKIFHSNDESYLQGIERGVEFANDGPLKVHGIFKSTSDKHALMLVVEDTDEDEIDNEYL